MKKKNNALDGRYSFFRKIKKSAENAMNPKSWTVK